MVTRQMDYQRCRLANVNRTTKSVEPVLGRSHRRNSPPLLLVPRKFPAYDDLCSDLLETGIPLQLPRFRRPGVPGKVPLSQLVPPEPGATSGIGPRAVPFRRWKIFP